MKTLVSLLVSFLLVCWAGSVFSTPIGAKFTLTSNGVNQVANDIVPVVVEAIQNAPIPDVSGETNVAIMGDIKYDITNIHLKTFAVGESVIALQPPSTITTSVLKIDILVSMNWHYRQKHFPWMGGSGKADGTTKGASVIVPMSVTLNYQLGKPVVAVTNVKVNLPKFNIHIYGSFEAWWFNLFETLFQGIIKKNIENTIIQTVQYTINQIGNQAIDSLNLIVPITPIAEADFSLVTQTITSLYVSYGSKGEVYYIPDPQEAPLDAPALPDTVNSQMLQIFISEFLPNSMFHVFYTADTLHALVTANDLPADFPFHLNTASFKTFLPKLYSLYPDQDMQVNITATKAPSFSFLPVGATAAFNFLFDFQVPLEDGFFDAFALSVSLNTQLELHIEPNADGQLVLAGSMKYMKFSMSTKYSHVGLFPSSLLNPVVQLFLEKSVIPAINNALATGMALPHVAGVSFVNPTISYGTGFATISSDISFKPQPTN